MTDMNTAHDDSMEEILASIRRIIADDGPAGAAPGTNGAAHQGEPSKTAGHAPVWRREPGFSAPQAEPFAAAPAPRVVPEVEDLEILDLSEDFLVAEEEVTVQYTGFAEPAAPLEVMPSGQPLEAEHHQEPPAAKWRLWDGQAPIRPAAPEPAAPGPAASAPEPAAPEPAAVALEAEQEPVTELREPEPEQEFEVPPPSAAAAIPAGPEPFIPVMAPFAPQAPAPAESALESQLPDEAFSAGGYGEHPASMQAAQEHPVAERQAPERPAPERPQARPVWSRRAAEKDGAAEPDPRSRTAQPPVREPAKAEAPKQPQPESRQPVLAAEPKPVERPAAPDSKPDYRNLNMSNGQPAPDGSDWAEGMPMPMPPADPTASLEALSAAAQAQQQAGSPGSAPQVAPAAQFADFDDDEDDSSDLPPDRSYLKAIATELARATIGSLGDKELRNAKKVDFSHLAGAAMDSVKDSFANVLSETDEARRAEAQAAAPQAAESSHQPPYAAAATHCAPEPQPEPPAAVPQSAPVPPPAQVFMPPMQMGGKSLEDGFRELLRPMILQWLDENMPRLLDDAVQQEVRRRLGKG
jgi:hypothetical protein